MRVWVHAARKHVLARSVDLPVGVDVQRLADHRDALALDVHVTDVVVGGRDDPPAFDQCRHVSSPPSGVGSGPATRPARIHASSLLAAFLQVTTDFLKLLPLTSQPAFFRFAIAFLARSVR